MTTIRGRLTRNILLAFCVPAIAGAVGVYMLVRHQVVAQFDRTLQAKALALSTVMRDSAGGILVDESSRLLAEFAAPEQSTERDDVSYFQILKPDGSVLRRSRSLGQSNLGIPGSISDARFGDVPLPDGRNGRFIAMNFSPRTRERGDARTLPTVTLVVAASRATIDETLRTLALILAGAGILLIAATFLVVPRLVERGFLPIRELAERSSLITSESLGIRFAAAAMPGELKPIAESLNALLTRLEGSFERERRFSADLAHELRTPLAELRSLAEVSLKWPENHSRDTDRDVHAIALQMEGLVTRLLDLLRSEQGHLAVVPERIDLSRFVNELWVRFDDRAKARGLRVTSQSSGDTTVTVDAVLLRSIVSNLFDNAADYTPANGSIHIEIAYDAASCVLRVTNDCSGLQPENLPMLFDRFWRQDTARSGGEHNGLGLPLARAFARTLGGDLTARLDQNRLTMTLQVP